VDKVLRNTAATVSVTFSNGSTALEADGVVTVVAKKADGSTLFSTNATNDPILKTYSTVIPAQANLNILTLTWTGVFSGTSISIVSNVEIVGGFYFSVGELRNYDSVIANNPTKYPDSSLLTVRDEVEAEFEDICHRAFVPRFNRETGIESDPDTSMLWLEKPEVIKFTSFTVNGTDYISWYNSGLFTRDKYSPRGVNVTGAATGLFAYSPRYYPAALVAEYEYGALQVPTPIKRKALKRAKMLLMGQSSTVDERATTMTLPDIGTVVLATPGQRGSETGVPDIDVVLRRYTIDGGAGVY
jgi:hypothetical protein